MDCLFCKLKDQSKERIIYKDDACYVLFDKYPSEEGHMLVISNSHQDDMISAPLELVDHMFNVARDFAMRSKRRLGASAVNVGTNIGKDAGQIIMHFHVHVIPRYGAQRRPKHKELTSEEELEMVSKMK